MPLFGLAGEMVTNIEYQFVLRACAPISPTPSSSLPYNIINARLGWQGERVQIYGFARNLFDENIEVAGTAFTPTVWAVTPGLEGRVIGSGPKSASETGAMRRLE